MMKMKQLEVDYTIFVGDELINMDDNIDTLFITRDNNNTSELLEACLYGFVSNKIIAKDNKLLIDEYNKDNINDISEIIIFNIKLKELYTINKSFIDYHQAYSK